MMQVLAAIAEEPLDPLFAFLSSDFPIFSKVIGVIFLTVLNILAPALLIIRLLQDDAIKAGRRNSLNVVPYWVICVPFLAITVGTAAYFSSKVMKLRTVAAVCPFLEWCGLTISLVLAVAKIQVCFKTTRPAPNFNRIFRA
jgi:hypothetical protein